MERPNSIETWIKEIYDFYNASLEDHVDLYYENKSMYFYRQYKFAPDYAIHARKASIEEEKVESIKSTVIYWFVTLPDEYDSVANENDFAFAFCYLYTNYLLEAIDKAMVWEVLIYITHHWEELEWLIKVPEEIY